MYILLAAESTAETDLPSSSLSTKELRLNPRLSTLVASWTPTAGSCMRGNQRSPASHRVGMTRFIQVETDHRNRITAKLKRCLFERA